MGGERMLERALDSLFIKDEYWHGNEPGHQIPFLYNFTAAPWKTQQIVRKILAEEYSDGAGGLSGNDDAGQMSAWYVFAAMGFYPLNPVSGEYLLTAPLFDHISLSTGNGATTEIITHKENAGAIYISKVMWNGTVYDKNFITYGQLMPGGKLEIWLVERPVNWGALPNNRPSGLSR
jgi:putative alpha-1,2-mannosidase